MTTVILIFVVASTKSRRHPGAVMAANEQILYNTAESSLIFLVSRLNFKKNFTATFYGWGSTASRLEPLRGVSLLFTSKFPEISGTHSTDLRRMKG